MGTLSPKAWQRIYKHLRTITKSQLNHNNIIIIKYFPYEKGNVALITSVVFVDKLKDLT